MHPRPPSPPQFELFQGLAPSGQRAPKLQLPFQQKDTIDLDRACNILDISRKRMVVMLDRKLIRAYKLLGLKKSAWQIEYASVVEYCDMLRVHNAIPGRSAVPRPGMRRRDHELLPFPKAETLDVAAVQRRLQCSQAQALALVESGTLTAYQILVDAPGCPWRIHSVSLDRYMERLHAMASK